MISVCATLACSCGRRRFVWAWHGLHLQQLLLSVCCDFCCCCCFFPTVFFSCYLIWFHCLWHVQPVTLLLLLLFVFIVGLLLLFVDQLKCQAIKFLISVNRRVINVEGFWQFVQHFVYPVISKWEGRVAWAIIYKYNEIIGIFNTFWNIYLLINIEMSIY